MDYRTVSGTALPKADYDAANGTLVFKPGIVSRTITITVKSDRTREPNETFSVELLNVVGAPVSDAVATGTIPNDDGTTRPAAADPSRGAKLERNIA